MFEDHPVKCKYDMWDMTNDDSLYCWEWDSERERERVRDVTLYVEFKLYVMI